MAARYTSPWMSDSQGRTIRYISQMVNDSDGNEVAHTDYFDTEGNRVHSFRVVLDDRPMVAPEDYRG